MKKLLLLTAFVVQAKAGLSQDNVTAEAKQFIVLYTLGESWDPSKAPNEQSYFSEHSSFLSGLRKNKQIVLGARYSDTGMIILLAKDEASAGELIRSDLAVQNKLFNVEIYPFSPFYKGCIE